MVIALSIAGLFVYFAFGVSLAALAGRYDRTNDSIAGPIVILWPVFLPIFCLALLYKALRG